MPPFKKTDGQGTAKKPVKKGQEAPAAERPVLYPTVGFSLCCVGGDQPPLTAAVMKKMLGWETEAEYVARMMSENPKLKEEECVFERKNAKGVTETVVDWLLTDENGQKVVCWNNGLNRPFRESGARQYAQTVIRRQWAGPLTMEGETVNGEDIIIGRTGLVLSGQHRGAGLILAHQIWSDPEKGVKARKAWPPEEYPDGPVMETGVKTGISESHRVVTTLDNVIPRTDTDVIYTSELLAGYRKSQKKTMSASLSKAAEFLWNRTHAGSDGSFRTRQEMLAFIERHKSKLLAAVKHVYDLQSKLGTLENVFHFKSGHSEACLYLMGCGATDADKLYGEGKDPTKVTERRMDWSLWDKAKEFFTGLANLTAPFAQFQEALAEAENYHVETNLRSKYRLAMLGKAWDLFQRGEEIMKSDLEIEWEIDYDSQSGDEVSRRPAEEGKFGNVDLGNPVKSRAAREEEEAAVEVGEEGSEGKDKPSAGPVETQERAEARRKKAEQIAAELNRRRKEAKEKKANGEGQPPA